MQVQHAVPNLRAQQCTKPAVLQQIRLEEACKELAALDKKAKDNKAKEKHAEAEVTKLADELENLPPMPQGNDERRRSLLNQRKDLDLQVCHPVANSAQHARLVFCRRLTAAHMSVNKVVAETSNGLLVRSLGCCCR